MISFTERVFLSNEQCCGVLWFWSSYTSVLTYLLTS